MAANPFNAAAKILADIDKARTSLAMQQQQDRLIILWRKFNDGDIDLEQLIEGVISEATNDQLLQALRWRLM